MYLFDILFSSVNEESDVEKTLTHFPSVLNDCVLNLSPGGLTLPSSTHQHPISCSVAGGFYFICIVVQIILEISQRCTWGRSPSLNCENLKLKNAL